MPRLVEKVVSKFCKDDDVEGAIRCIRDYLFPYHESSCDALGVADDKANRFLRIFYEIRMSGASKLLHCMCEKNLWEVCPEERSVFWRETLKDQWCSDLKTRKL